MTKEEQWILARLDGMSDEDARSHIGCSSRPAGKSYKLLNACLMLLQQPAKRREELSLYYERRAEDLRTELKNIERFARAAKLCANKNRSHE